MSVVVLSQALHPAYGGSAVSEASLAAHLSKHRTVHVICPRGTVDPVFVAKFGLTGVKEFRIVDVLAAVVDSRHWLGSLIRQARILHVNGHWKWEFAVLAEVARRAGVPYVLQPRGMLWQGYRYGPHKWLFNRLLGYRLVSRARGLIALSHFETSQWEPYRVPRSHWVVLPNGINAIEPAARLSAPSSGPDPYLLYFGRLEPRKNLPFLLHAFRDYRQRGGRARLRLVGPVERGCDRALRKTICELDMEALIRIESPRFGDTRALLAEAQAVVYPARGEPFGRVPFETLAAGGVPIVPKESGAGEYLRQFIPYCLYPEADQDALVECLLGSERREQWVSELERARNWVSQALNWSLLSARYDDYYEQCHGNEAP